MKGLILLLALFSALKVIASPEPQIGGVLQHDGAYEISVIYTEPVDTSTLSDSSNYGISSGSIAALRLCATNQGVILTVNGLVPGEQGSVLISNILDPSGNPVPDATLDFATTGLLWANIGANELGFPYDAYGVTTNAYDLISGGIQQRDEYDDATFVGESLQGDFEVKVRVDYVDPAGAGAKAGIMIREQLDEGKARPLNPDDPSQAFSRYVELAVSAPASVLGEPNDAHEIWQRAVSPGLDTISVTVTNDASPAFTNAWLRIVRAGQDFTMWRSIDGEHWDQIGEASFDTPLADTVYVGLAWCPQNDDIPPTSDLRGSFVAKFRDFALTPKSASNLKIQMLGDHAEVTWDAGWTLETAPAVTGPWTNATSQTSPLRVDFTEGMRFYRLHQNP
jgi:regulation of enolase protein 1 (concanavalin A-like superfamily)